MKKSVKKARAVVKKETLPEKVLTGVRAITAVDPQALLAQAIDKGMPVESMERLLVMRREMKAEYAREQFFKALAGFQRECPVIGKDRVAKIRSKKGDESSFSYRYAPLETIVAMAQPVLERWGFSWTCKPSQTETHVKAAVHAHHVDGHEEVTEFSVPLDPTSYMSEPQKAAAASTFARRYAFINAFGITTKGEDHDGDGPRRSDNPVTTVFEIGKPKSDDELKGLYDTICSQIGKLPTEQANKLRDTADRNMDNKNGEALSALLESVKRQVASKVKPA